MCYDKAVGTKFSEDYAKVYGITQEEIERYRRQLEEGLKPTFHQSGFQHLSNPVITNELPGEIQFYSWGLIPFFTDTEQQAGLIRSKCLNARGETIFSKNSFREAAKKRRCLVIAVDGFYEYHHAGKETHPFFIQRKDRKPITFAGVWESWRDPAGIVRKSYTIVTTKANRMMGVIHNNPKQEIPGGRMPVILAEEEMRTWLITLENKDDREAVENLIRPYPDGLLEAWPVGKLRGKLASGNSPEAMKPIVDSKVQDLIRGY